MDRELANVLSSLARLLSMIVTVGFFLVFIRYANEEIHDFERTCGPINHLKAPKQKVSPALKLEDLMKGPANPEVITTGGGQ